MPLTNQSVYKVAALDPQGRPAIGPDSKPVFDVFETGTNRKIELPEFQQSQLNIDLIQPQQATSNVAQNVQEANPFTIDVEPRTRSSILKSMEENPITSVDLEARINALQAAPPELPSLVDEFEVLRGDYGIEGLTNQLSALDKQIAQARAAGQRGQNIAGAQAIATPFITGQQRAIADVASTNEQLLIDQRNAIVNELNTKNQIIGQIMELTQADYSNAVNKYNNDFQRNLAMVNLVNQEIDKQEQRLNEADQRKLQMQQIAQANWQTLYGLVSEQGLGYEELDPATQAQLDNLALQAGLPGVNQLLRPNLAGEVANVTSRTDAAGNSFYDVLRIDRDGKMSVESIFRGKEAVSGSGSGLSSILSQLGGSLEGLDSSQQESVIGTLINNLPSATERESAFNAVATFKNGSEILSLLDEGVGTGPISNLQREGVSIFGIPIIPGGRRLGSTTESENKLDTAMTAFTANFIKAISGAQVSDREREFLMNALPSSSKQESVNRANIEMLTKFLSNKLESQIGVNIQNFPDVFPTAKNQAGSAAEDYLSQLGL